MAVVMINYHTNKTEVIDNLISSASYLDDEYVTEKIMTLMGDKDKVEEVMERKAKADVKRMTTGKPEGEDEDETDEDEVNADQEGEQEV